MHDFIGLIFYMFRRAVPPALIGLAAGVALLVPLNRKRRREGARFPRGQAAAILLLLCYLGGLAAVTFMNRMESGMGMGIQLRPFLAFWEAWNAFTLQVWLNPLLNVAMFLPLGVLLPLSVKRFQQWYWMLAVGAGISLVIEGLQHFLSRGQADVDDLICNTLGAMLGYCLVMLFLSLKGKRWKCAGAYAALPVLSIAALAGVFLAYHFQPYGNLADAPIYAANTKGVEWVQECALSDEPGPSGVYWAEPFTRESCDAFAAEFLGQLGVKIDFESPDVDVSYYDYAVVYTDHTTYDLLVNYKDRSYAYIDYRVDSALRYSDKGGTITEAELRATLKKLGIAVPDTACFITLDEEKGNYAFQAERLVEDGVLTDGKLTCWVAEGGILFWIENALSVSTLHKDAAVISPQEAYDRLCAGRFSWRDVPMFDALPPKKGLCASLLCALLLSVLLTGCVRWKVTLTFWADYEDSHMVPEPGTDFSTSYPIAAAGYSTEAIYYERTPEGWRFTSFCPSDALDLEAETVYTFDYAQGLREDCSDWEMICYLLHADGGFAEGAFYRLYQRFLDRPNDILSSLALLDTAPYGASRLNSLIAGPGYEAAYEDEAGRLAFEEAVRLCVPANEAERVVLEKIRGAYDSVLRQEQAWTDLQNLRFSFTVPNTAVFTLGPQEGAFPWGLALDAEPVLVSSAMDGFGPCYEAALDAVTLEYTVNPDDGTESSVPSPAAPGPR